MEGTTTNINLIKPGENEFYDVNINNHNSDIIDLEIYNLKTNKVDKVAGKGLSANDYTNEEKQKLSSIEEGAEKNKVASVNNKYGDVVLSAADVGAETPTGSQAKANIAENNAKDYADAKLSTKVDKVAGKGLSTNDYTDEEKQKNQDNANNILALQQNLDEHKADDMQHITSQERKKWNGKQNALPIENRRKITFGTADPSGGEDGDIYFQYE